MDGTRPTKKVSVLPRQGFVNGLGLTSALRGNLGMVNGTGRTNGLTNGLGRVNGTGTTNGLRVPAIRSGGRTNGLANGIVNGNGLVNGRGLVNGTRRPLRANAFGIVTHKDVRMGVSLTLLFILILPSFYLIMSLPAPTSPMIRIDGTFDDWAAVPSYVDTSTGTLDDIDFSRYALYDDGDSMYVYFRVRGQLFPGIRDYDGFCAFIDADGNPDTGYWPMDLGAEYAVRIYGTDAKMTAGTLLRYELGQDLLNWTAWQGVSAVSAASSADSVEFALYTRGLNLGERYSLRLTGDDFAGHSSQASFKMGRAQGSLLVEQSPRSSMSPLTPSSNDVLQLTFRARGMDIDIPNPVTDLHWEAYPTDLVNRLQLPNQLHIEAGEDLPVTVGLDTSGLAQMSLVWLNLTGVDVSVPLTITGSGGVGYVVQLPSYKIVDGWFGDWQTGLTTDTSAPLSNANVDIAAYSSNVTQISGYDKALFYVEFRGKAMAGSAIPARIQWMQPGQPVPPGTPAPRRRIAGEDSVVVYVDSNSTDSQGCRAGSVAADYRLEFIGHRRRVDSTALYRCVSGGWSKVAGMTPKAIASAAKMEMSIDLSALGQLNAPTILIESSDWSGIGDIPPLIGLRSESWEGEGTRGEQSPRILHGPNADQITSLPLSVDPIINGQCDDDARNSAGYASGPGYEFWVGHRNSKLWVCIIFQDTTNDALDEAELMLDTLHDGDDNGDFPQPDDRKFTLFANTIDPNGIIRMHGTGAIWDVCEQNTCSPGDQGRSSFTNGYQNYEFSLNQLNVWAPGHDRAGFAIRMFNATNLFNRYWGSSGVDINKPSTWGHLDIPEFPFFIVPVLMVMALLRPRRKRRLA